MTTKTSVNYNADKSWTITVEEDGKVKVNQTVKFEGLHQLAMMALLAEVMRYKERERLWTEPNAEMVQAGLAEVQRMLDDWDADGHITLGSCNDPVSDDQASDLAVFVLQAMAGKLPKVGE